MKLYVTVKDVESVPKENVTCDFTDRLVLNSNGVQHSLLYLVPGILSTTILCLFTLIPIKHR